MGIIREIYPQQEKYFVWRHNLAVKEQPLLHTSATQAVPAPQAAKLPEGKPLLNDLDLLDMDEEISVSFYKQMKNEMAVKLGT